MRQPTFQEYIRLCRDADTMIKKLFAEAPKLQSRKPKTLKAAAIHYLARKKGLNITLASFMSTA